MREKGKKNNESYDLFDDKNKTKRHTKDRKTGKNKNCGEKENKGKIKKKREK